MPQLLGQLADQSRGPGQQGEAAQQFQRQVEVGERRAADTGAVERQRLPEHLRVGPADRFEEREVRTELPLLAGDLEQSRSARVAVLVHVVAQAGDEETGLALAAYDVERDRVPARVVGRCGGQPLDDVVQEPAAVLGDPQEPRAAAEQPGRQRALHRVRCGQVGQPGHDRGGREAMVGQGGEHRFEDPHFSGLGSALRGQPEGELAEADAAHDVAGEVLPQQGDRLPAGGTQRRLVRRLLGHDTASPSQARSSAPCSSSSGGGSA